MSCGSIAWAGAGAASVTSPTTTSTTATSWNEGAWRSMSPSIRQGEFPPIRDLSTWNRVDGLEDGDGIDRRACHVLETERGHGQEELPALEPRGGLSQLLQVGVVDQPEAHGH